MASYSKFILLSFTRATSYRGVSCRPVSVTTRASVCVHVCQTVTTRCFIETDGRLELEKKTEVSFDMSYATITGNTGIFVIMAVLYFICHKTKKNLDLYEISPRVTSTDRRNLST